MCKTVKLGQQGLTTKQYDCLAMYVVGRTAKVAGIYLDNSPKTIETHWKDIRIIFNVENRTELMMVLHEGNFLVECINHYLDIIELRRLN